MNARKFIIRETAYLALGELLCIAAMIGIFALLNSLDYTVIVGAIIGMILAVGNFFFMAIGSNAAADKAVEQDVKGGKSAVKVSYTTRLFVIGILMVLFAKSGHCNPLAMGCPLIFVFPLLTVIEFFRKTGEVKS